MIRMLEDGPPDEATRAACLKNLSLIQRETERCTVIVRNLLDFARVRPLELRVVDPTARARGGALARRSTSCRSRASRS